MMASRVTPAAKEEEAKVEGVEKEEGTTEAIGASVSTHGRFGQNWALLRRTKLALMAPIVVKYGESGMRMEKWRRIHVIAEGKMSLSCVAVS